MRVLFILCMFVVASWGQLNYNIISYLTARRYTLFVNYLQQTGLTSTLNGAGPFTVFAPSNSYFYRLDPSIRNNTAKLTDVMKYHIVSGNYSLADLSINEKQLPTLLGSNIRMNHYYTNNMVLAEGQRLYSGNYYVSNGIIHLMYGVMVPPAGTVLDIISKNKNLTTFHTAVTAAGLENFFQDQNPITLFAPTEKAFNYLGADKLQALIHNPTLLASILKYHVIPGSLYAAAYHNDYMHTFEEADRLKIDRYINGNYEVENGLIDRVETSATNGVVHQIDQVLIPSSLLDQVNALTSN